MKWLRWIKPKAQKCIISPLSVGNSLQSDSRKEGSLVLCWWSEYKQGPLYPQSWNIDSAYPPNNINNYLVMKTDLLDYVPSFLLFKMLFDSYIVNSLTIKIGVKNSAYLCCSWQNFKWSQILLSSWNQTRSYRLDVFLTESY